MQASEKDYIRYEITGVEYRTNKRFKITTTNAMHCAGINLWRGSKWGVKPDGTRKLLVRIYN
jgi:hypothetical protein